MNISFRSLVPAEVPRPVVDVQLEGLPEFPLPCLIDPGSLNNRFGMWVAREAGIDLTSAPIATAGVGGTTVTSRTAIVTFSLGRWTWEAPVAFCDPWPWDFNLLGQEGFLRWFVVTLDAAQQRLTIRKPTR